MGFLRALRDRGLKVQPFKCGPDYIDTMFHEIASGRESVNLDTYMSSPEHVKEIFERYSADADVSIVEGVMGMFDGYDKDKGSSAEIAMLLDIPVILVVNAKSVAYSVAPLIYGFKHFNPAVKIAGVVFNMVASENHYTFLKQACEDACVPCLGYIPRNRDLIVPGRHLGLTIETKEEMEELIENAKSPLTPEGGIVDRLLAPSQPDTYSDVINIGLPRGEEIFSQSDKRCEALCEPVSPSTSPLRAPAPSLRGRAGGEAVISIARDSAFNFTYRANIDSLREVGDVKFFSPLEDERMPECDLLYLPGGYPELFASELADNASMRESIKAFAENGGKIFAECGGFMYLCNDIDGIPMCGVFPFSATMMDAKLHLGYRQLPEEKASLRGHEFHYSSVVEPDTLPEGIKKEQCQLSAKGKTVDTALYHYKNVIAGYTHWYWAEKGF
ncbi:MAG: cobyrinate a,c-diamide synthase, partial [Prevotellaceae bacterium]|nr:cobyrinate a,c-diamide synthase [Prevotellaceae bacterium]